MKTAFSWQARPAVRVASILIIGCAIALWVFGLSAWLSAASWSTLALMGASVAALFSLRGVLGGVIVRLHSQRSVLRARGVFRTALCAAQRHPEFVDMDRVSRAAATLRAHGSSEMDLPEVQQAASHNYRPLRLAAHRVLHDMRPQPAASTQHLGM